MKKKNHRGLQRYWEPGFLQLHTLPKSLLETGKHFFQSFAKNCCAIFFNQEAVWALLIIWKRQNCTRPEGPWNRKGPFTIQRLRSKDLGNWLNFIDFQLMKHWQWHQVVKLHPSARRILFLIPDSLLKLTSKWVSGKHLFHFQSGH